MTIRLHHAFIITAEGAPEAEKLVDIGMVEGSSNDHPGQGTANRRFFFEDFYLELVFFTDREEARTGPGRVIRSIDRFESETGSPFGLVFRAEDSSDVSAFPGFRYQPVYFEEGQQFLIGDNADLLEEPTIVLAPPNLPDRPQHILSPAPFEQLTALRLGVPVDAMSPALARSASVDRVAITTGKPNHLQLEFCGRHRGGVFDLRPTLPLVVCC